MKKFIIGMGVGYTICGLKVAYHDRAFHRAYYAIKYLQTGDTEVSHQEIFRYVAYNEVPETLREDEEVVDASVIEGKLPRVRAMHDEGYSYAEIAEAMDIPESLVQVFIEDDATMYRTTLSKNQHELVELALRQLSPGDEDSQAEVDATLTAFLETTERLR